MKKILFITFVTAAVLCCFAYSCAKQNDYDTYVETTTERFSTVDEQVAYLEGLLVTLGAEKSLLENYADSLATAGDARAEVVDSLLDDLGKKMQAVDDSLAKYATKEWADATFATLDAVKTLSGTAAALAMKVKDDSTAIAGNIEESIKKSEEELTKMFEDYYKSDTVGIMINALKTRLDTFPDKVKAVKDSVALLRKPVSDLQTKYAALSGKLDSSVSALKKQDTVFMKQIDSLNGVYSGKLDTLSGEVAANKAKLDELTGRIAKLEARVQSVEVVPDYIDGGVKMMKYSTAIKFEVRPASAAKALVAKGVSAFSLQAMQVKAVTKASIYTTITVQSASIDAEDSLLVLKVKGSDMPADFSAGTQAYSARLSINNGNTGKSSPYFPLTYVDFTPSYPEAPELECVEINGTIWAPVNCGYDSTNYKYGKIYQWGRKYGCGYKASEGTTKYDDAGDIIQKTSTTDVPISASAEDSTIFYKIYNAPYDWLTPQDNKRWMKDGAKTANDPCPAGWRVPAKTEFEALINVASKWTSQAEINGRLFADKLFLPAAGIRDEFGAASLRSEQANYWSLTTTPNQLYSYSLFFTEQYGWIDENGVRAAGYPVRCVME